MSFFTRRDMASVRATEGLPVRRVMGGDPRTAPGGSGGRCLRAMLVGGVVLYAAVWQG